MTKMETGLHHDRCPGTLRWLLSLLLIVLVLVVLFWWKYWMVDLRQNRASTLLNRRENNQALLQLQVALRWDTADAETYFMLARAYRRLGQMRKVRVFLRRAEALGGDLQRVERERWMMWAQLGKLRKAEPHLADLMIDSRGDGKDICEAYVQGYFSNLRIMKARQLIDVWQKQFPQDPKPHFMLAFLYQSLADLPAAVASYRKGLELVPEDSNTASSNTAKWSTAETSTAELATAKTVNDKASMRCRLAEVLLEQHNYQEADQLLQQCAQEAPERAAVLFAQANSLFQQGQGEEAIEKLEQLLKRHPTHFEAHRLLAEIASAEGRFELAVDHSREAVKQRPYDTTAHNTLGNALLALGKPDRAKAHLEYVAAAESSLGRMERQLRQVVDDPTNTQLRYEIGKTLLQYGAPADGLKWIRSVLEIDPEHQLARQALTRVGSLHQIEQAPVDSNQQMP